VHTELGGKSPAVVFEDADLESAAAQTQFSIRSNSGQVCVASSRIYVQEFVADRFIQLFREKFTAVTAGDPLDHATSHGPQIDAAQYSRIQEYLRIGEKGGSLALGGDSKDGFLVKPTIFERVLEDSRLMREEVFGPVVAINTFKRRRRQLRRLITPSLASMPLSLPRTWIVLFGCQGLWRLVSLL